MADKIYRLTFQKDDGTEESVEFTAPQGEPGKDGIDGKDGQDGYTPIKGVDYFDGKDGNPGKDGADGQPGADGKDYILTEADKKEIANMVEVPEGGNVDLTGYAKIEDIPTDAHINDLINTALGVIENGTY